VLTVFLFAYWLSARRLGEANATQWLGTRSFSLYLVHEPIVVSIALLLGGRPNPFLMLALALPASLLGSDLFYRAVEGPSHRASQAVGRIVDAQTAV
jgi:peptidoglycan/LPS O-acetylase OafA/YrhL